MISYHNGDLLESGCEIICHQVNLQGVMGGGLALQIATKHPNVEKEYKWFVSQIKNKEDLLGCCIQTKCIDKFTKDLKYYVANMFSQNIDFTTNIEALKQCIKELKRQIKTECTLYLVHHIVKVGIPYKYGCGIATGDWNEIEKIWVNAFKNETNIELQIWKLN